MAEINKLSFRQVFNPDVRYLMRGFEKRLEDDPAPVPAEPRYGYVLATFTALSGNVLDLKGAYAWNDGAEILAQHVAIDNRDGNEDVTLTLGAPTNFRRVVPAGVFASFPVPSCRIPEISISSAGNRPVPIFFYNYPLPPEWTDSLLETRIVSASVTALGDLLVVAGRFRLMGYRITATQNATLAVAGIVTLTFRDNATGFAAHAIYLPAAINLNDHYDSGWVNLKHGYFSAEAGLNLNLAGAALTAGSLQVTLEIADR